MLPLCREEGIGVIPWSPLARGRLARAWEAPSERMANDAFGRELYKDTLEQDRRVVERLGEVAAARGEARARVALAWVLAKPEVTAPIIGATQMSHLDDAVAALDIKLSATEIALLEEPYVPHAVVGHE